VRDDPSPGVGVAGFADVVVVISASYMWRPAAPGFAALAIATP
jgi:hypothetical protein